MLKSKVKTKTGDEQITAYRFDEFEPSMLVFTLIQRNHKYKYYANDFMVLDTETSHINDEDSWIYQWAIKFQGKYIYGRKPSEIILFLEALAEYYGLNDDKKIICYIHNASYDIQYLKHFLAKYDPRISILAIDNHTMLQIDVLGFRLLCSYKLSNMSLAKLSESYASTYIKAVGEIDYTKIRYQDTNLTEVDWYYMFSDVASQHDGITGYIHAMGYDLACDCPITSTGFVRKACRTAALDTDYWREQFEQSALNLAQYDLCRQAFMGGVTICSFKYAGKTIRSKKLRHKDFTSSYPARQMINYMPVGAPIDYGDVKTMQEFNELLGNYCCIFTVKLRNVHIKEGITAPYIPSSKCFDCDVKNLLKVNGKVVYADELTIAICELDWQIIQEQYTFDEDISVGSMTLFERGECPEWLKKEVMHYFKNKCTLKDIDEYRYMRSKAFLNAIYGMTATSILRETFKIDQDMIIQKAKEKDDDKREKDLKKYYKSYNSFMPYQLAIFTTAWARFELFRMIRAVGYDNFLYCDTDSVFYIETKKNRIAMAKYTQECRQRAIEHEAFINNNYLGLPTDEPRIRAFRGLHAKCYAMEEWNKKTNKFELKVTIAGVSKVATKFVDGKAVTMTNAQELKKIDNLVDGFKFEHCGGIRAIYNERPIEVKDINGHKTELASNVIIDSIVKEVNDTMWTEDENGELCNIPYSEVI